MKTILAGIVGSTAYGLNTENSDIDKLGVYLADTEQFWSLDKPEETIVQTSPDVTMHEIEKYLRLALKCNPTLLELLWLPEELYTEKMPGWGDSLINLREYFLSSSCVISAYGGYAYQQAKKFKESTSQRKYKHVIHCFRLLRQGKELLTTGNITLKVQNPEEYHSFHTMNDWDIIMKFEKEYKQFNSIYSCLADKPALYKINAFLHNIRFHSLWTDGGMKNRGKL